MKNLKEKKKKLKEFIKGLNIGSKDPKFLNYQDACVVSKVEHFDPDSNQLWDLDANKSYPREGLICDSCKAPCVMSNSLYEAYMGNPNPPKVVCGECIFGFIKK